MNNPSVDDGCGLHLRPRFNLMRPSPSTPLHGGTGEFRRALHGGGLLARRSVLLAERVQADDFGAGGLVLGGFLRRLIRIGLPGIGLLGI